MKKVLIISSNYTGHGHKSITEALCEQFEKYSSAMEVYVAEAFDIGWPVVKVIGKMYTPLTTHARFLWNAYYKASYQKPKYVNALGVPHIEKGFLHMLSNVNPDLIVTVHPGFVGSIINILEHNNINIPVVTVVADLISIHPIWADKRSLFTICPTEEAKQRLMGYGVPEEKLKVLGFPIRKRFCVKNNFKIKKSATKDTKPHFLLVNGCEKRSGVKHIINDLLNNFDCTVTIITGRDEKLKKLLEENFTNIPNDRLNILGYVTNMEYYMSSSDVLIARGSPNVLMEAVNSCLPVVIIGALPGQEEENPYLMVKYNLAIACDGKENLIPTIEELFKNNYERLNSISQSQLNYRDINAAEKTADFIANILDSNDLHKNEGSKALH